MFLVIVAQSAATSRSFAERYGERLDENRDLLGLAAANLLAGVSSSFVVNGSPTKTAVVDAAGSRTQLAQLITAVVVLAVVLVATALIGRLPVAALAGLVFLIGVKLIDVASLRDIYHFRRTTFAVALATLVAVVWLGVEHGLFVAIALSVLDHLRQEYHPKDVVLSAPRGRWKANRAERGIETEPGLVVYRFEAPLFFANADYFSLRVRDVVTSAPHDVEWLVLDMVSVDDIDYTGGLTLAMTVRQLQKGGVTVALAAAEDIRTQLQRIGVMTAIGSHRLFETVQDAIDAWRRERRS